jgi:hypothetical protein
MRALGRSGAQGLAQQISQLMSVIVKLIDVGRVLPHEFHRERKGAGRIDVVVAEDFIVHRTGPKHVRLQRYLDGDRLFAPLDQWRRALTAARPRLFALQVRLLAGEPPW